MGKSETTVKLTASTELKEGSFKGYPIWIQSSVCLFGMLLYFASFSPLIAQAQIFPDIMRQLGVGVLVFGITSFALTHWYSNLAGAQLIKLGEEMKSLTIDTFDLVKSARDSGIARIYPLRTGELSENPDVSKAFRERIKMEFAKAAQLAIDQNKPATIRMIGVSLREFFNDAGSMYQLAENALHNNLLHFQILLIDPFSAQAGMRSEREWQTQEDQEYPDVKEHFTSTLFQDMQKCTRTLMRFMKPDNRVQVRLYSTTPSCLLVFINESVFVETYHYGRSGVGGLKGGKVPVLEFHSDTNSYKELEGHFDHVWFKSRNRILDKQLTAKINSPRETEIEQLKIEFSWLSGSQTNSFDATKNE